MKNGIKKFAPYWVIETLRCIKGLVNGTWPMAWAQINLARSSDSNTLTGKIRQKMAFDRNPILTLLADKVSVRDYVADKVGERYLSKAIAVLDSADALSDLDLPQNFALKTNHGSGGMIIVWDQADSSFQLPQPRKMRNWDKHLVHPSNFDIVQATQHIKQWLSQNYFYYPGKFPEWAYKNIQPKLMVEELMLDNLGKLPNDYKFFMSMGVCQFIQVDSSRFESHRRDLYLPNWQLIQGQYLYPNSGDKFARPSELAEMLDVATALSRDLDFVRVDLYLTKNGIKFGEMTNYPEAGSKGFTPQPLDSQFATNWNPKY